MEAWRRFRDWSVATPLRFVLIWGVVAFGGLYTLATAVITAALWRHAVMAPLGLRLAVGAAAGLAWGLMMWLWRRHRIRRAAGPR